MSFHKWVVGLALALIMVSALGVNALLFSARNFQFNLAQIAPDTYGVIDVAALFEAQRQVEEIEAATAQTRAALTQVENQLAELDGAARNAEQQRNAARAEVAGALAEIEARAQAPVAESAALLDAPALQGRIAALAARTDLAPADQQSLAALRGEVDELIALEDSLGARDAERVTLAAQQRLLGGQVAEADRRIIALRQAVAPHDQFGRILNEVRALDRTSPLHIGTTLVQLHPTVMSTVLVLLMGLLGAILYLFPAYMSRANPVTFAEIAVRSIFGMVTALAFYIVANATLAGFSFVPTSQGGATLNSAAAINPFTVSLIGIIAGIMADDIARWIRNRGSELFGGAAPAATTTTANTQDGDASFAGVNPHGGPNVG